MCYFDADGKRFKWDIRVMHVKDLNFVLHSKIFVNSDGRLRVSHLTLGYILVYSTWQPFGQALLVNSLLLLYIEVWHSNLLHPKLTAGKAQDFGPCFISAKSLVPARHALVDLVS